MSIVLYHAPGACSRVTLNALEETGVTYEDRTVAFMKGEQKSPQYLAINSKGKVPVLVADGTVITENPAILFHLARTYPAAGLLPRDSSAEGDLRGLSDVIWCGGTLHPLLHRFFRPGLYTEGGQEARVRAAAETGLHGAAKAIADRLAGGRWWYGDAWSIVDAYLNWIFGGAARAGFPRGDYPALVEHGGRVEARPAFQQARRREIDSVARDGVPLMPGVEL